MSFRDPGRSTHRKRGQLSIDGTVAGVEYSRARRGYNPSPFNHAPGIDLPHPAQAYEPDPGQLNPPEPQYEPYERDVHLHATPPIRFGTPTEARVEGPPSYDASLMTDELFHRAMQESAGYPASDEPVPLEQIVGDPLQVDPFSEIEAAIDQEKQQMEHVAQPFAELMQEPEPPPEQMYDDPWMMDPFGMPDPMGPGPMM